MCKHRVGLIVGLHSSFPVEQLTARKAWIAFSCARMQHEDRVSRKENISAAGRTEMGGVLRIHPSVASVTPRETERDSTDV